MYKLEPIADIGQCPTHDDAHGVVHVGLFELVFDIDREDFPCHFLRIFCHSGHLSKGDGRAAGASDRSAKLYQIPTLEASFSALIQAI